MVLVAHSSANIMPNMLAICKIRLLPKAWKSGLVVGNPDGGNLLGKRENVHTHIYIYIHGRPKYMISI